MFLFLILILNFLGDVFLTMIIMIIYFMLPYNAFFLKISKDRKKKSVNDEPTNIYTTTSQTEYPQLVQLNSTPTHKTW